jgi:hypothetical protein
MMVVGASPAFAFIVGTGTTASCAEAALNACLPDGGSCDRTVAFAYGATTTITVTKTISTIASVADSESKPAGDPNRSAVFYLVCDEMSTDISRSRSQHHHHYTLTVDPRRSEVNGQPAQILPTYIYFQFKVADIGHTELWISRLDGHLSGTDWWVITGDDGQLRETRAAHVDGACTKASQPQF